MANDTDIVEDVIIDKKYDDEWADIYHVKVIDGDYINNSQIDEFEWSFYLMNHCKYMLLPKIRKDGELDYSIPEEMETRAMKINRDIFHTADKHEKKILNSKKFISTKYILNYRCKK